MGVDDDPKTQTTPSEALAVTDFKQTRNTDLEQELALIGIPGEDFYAIPFFSSGSLIAFHDQEEN